MSVRATNSLYNAFQLIAVIALTGWLAAYSYEDHQQGQCLRAFNTQMKATQAHEHQLQAKAAEIAKMPIRTSIVRSVNADGRN
jgi:hypothetical protein